MIMAYQYNLNFFLGDKMTILEKQHTFKGFLSFPIQTVDVNMKAHRSRRQALTGLSCLVHYQAMRPCWVSGSWINLPSPMSKSRFLSLRKMRGWQEISCEHSESEHLSLVSQVQRSAKGQGLISPAAWLPSWITNSSKAGAGCEHTGALTLARSIWR